MLRADTRRRATSQAGFGSSESGTPATGECETLAKNIKLLRVQNGVALQGPREHGPEKILPATSIHLGR